MMASLFSWVFVLSIGQAAFLIVALLSSRQREVRTANRLMAALLLGCIAVLGHAWLGVQGLYRAYPHSANAIATLGLLPGQLLYLYLRTMLFEHPLARREWLHFVPFALATLALMPFYLQSAEAKLAWMASRGGVPWYIALAALLKTLLFLAYVVAGYRLMARAGDSPLAAGLARLMKIWLVGGVLSIAALAVEFADVALPVSSDAIGGLGLFIFVYATALLAVRLPLSYRPQAEPSKAKYAGKLVPESERPAFLAALTKSMQEDQVFRNGELKLDELAAMLALTPHELSQLINDSCGVNFQEYMNGYRVEALKKALHAPAQAGESILDLGLSCGFNSKSALNRVFKQIVGMTPSEYRKQVPDHHLGRQDAAF